MIQLFVESRTMRSIPLLFVPTIVLGLVAYGTSFLLPSQYLSESLFC